MSDDDYCELCDLPLSQCPHGRPPAPEPLAAPAPAPKSRKAAAPRAKKQTGPPVTAKATARRWTSSGELEPLIVDILIEVGGTASNDAVLAEIEMRLAETFRSGDQDRTPTGELRWQLAARKARQSLISQELMTKDQPGVWSLRSDVSSGFETGQI